MRRRTDLYEAMMRVQSDLGEGYFVLEDDLVIHVSPAFSRISGYSMEEITAPDFLDKMASPEMRGLMVARFRERLSGRQVPDRYETSIRHKSGRRVDLEVAVQALEGGEARQTLVIVHDITERKRAEAALRESEERFRAMADTAPVLLWMSGPDSRRIYFNYPWLEFTGRSLSQELGEGWAQGVYPEDLGLCFETYHSAFAKEEPFRTEYRLRRRDGAWRWIIDSGAPRYLPNGEFAGYIGSCIDITERKQVEQEREAARQAAEDALKENARLLEEVRRAARRQRIFLREILEIATEGGLRLCDTAADLPAPLPVFESDGWIPLKDAGQLRYFRHCVMEAAERLNFFGERLFDLITGAGEAAMNAVVHGSGGEGCVFIDPEAGRVQVWVRDRGKGIDVNLLHRATLERGFTTAGSLGHGFWMTLKTCDRCYLLTGSSGTTVVLEQDRSMPKPPWLPSSDTPHAPPKLF